jgi:hypothetical protein
MREIGLVNQRDVADVVIGDALVEPRSTAEMGRHRAIEILIELEHDGSTSRSARR